MDITYRPAKFEDLEDAERVVQEAGNELRVRHGRQPWPAPPPIAFPKFCLAEDPDGLWVAEHGDTIVGFGFSWMTETVLVFVATLCQASNPGEGHRAGSSVENPNASQRNGATNRALITPAYNITSTGLYLNNGLYPREPLYRMAAPAQAVAQNLADAGYDTTPIAPWPEPREWMAEIDGSCSGSDETCTTAFCSAAARRARFGSSERAAPPAMPTSPPRAMSVHWQSHRTPMRRRS